MSGGTLEAPALPSGLRVALVHDWLTGSRGGEKVLEALATLAPEAPIFTLLHLPGTVGSALEARTIHTSFVQRLPGARRGYRRYLPLFPAAIEDFDLGAFDLVLSSSHCVAKGVVPGPEAVHICYCHSPMRYAWDQEHVYFPRRRGAGARIRNLLLSGLRAWDAASSHRVDAFVANSRFVARRIRRYYGREAEVIAPPVDVDAFMARQAASQDGAANGTIPYDRRDGERRCLMVAALAPYKRIEVAIAACARLGLGLDIVGGGPHRRALERRAGAGCRLLGRVDDETLRTLYREATCFVQPGIEDFGIAAVESLASGTPVVALGRGGVLDIVDDGAHGVLYDVPRSGGSDPFDDEVAALCAAIDKCRGIRFNSLELQSRARTFSHQAFIDRMKRCIARRLCDWRPLHDDSEASP